MTCKNCSEPSMRPFCSVACYREHEARDGKPRLIRLLPPTRPCGECREPLEETDFRYCSDRCREKVARRAKANRLAQAL